VTDVDVVVAGAGAAGCAAAAAAAQQGCSVLIVEAVETFQHSSNTAMSTAMIPAAGSRWQQDAGIDDSPDLFLSDIVAKTKGTADQVVARALVDEAPRLVEWLADSCQVPLSLVTEFTYPGHSRPRCHTVPDRAGSTLHRHLLRAAREGGDLMVPARLASLEQVPFSNEWTVGLQAVDSVEEVTARAVILATNGFAANRERVTQLLPGIASGMYFGGEGSVGTALDIAEQMGWQTSHLDAYQGHGSVAVPHGILATWALIMHGGIVVNDKARRFADESLGYSEFAESILSQDGGCGWLVFDARIDELCRVFADHDRLTSAGAVRWAEDATGLAEVTGLPESSLSATLQEIQDARTGWRADVFGRTQWGEGLHPSYAAVRITGALFHTQGGLRIDQRARVLANGVPVTGVLAAGGAAVGISGHGAGGYLAGNGLLAALGLGRIAGLTAADLCRGEDRS
jgi:fumarate reductase flavoprotein subunit